MNKAWSYFGGIDFSGAREPLSTLWTALGHEEDGRLHIRAVRPHAFRSDLSAYVAGGWRTGLEAAKDSRILWGADFPFGLPAAVTGHLSESHPEIGTGWEAIVSWIADRPADEIRDAAAANQRALRVTDTGGALPALDIRLYKQTIEGVRWLHELREAAEVSIHPQAPDTGAATALIEVYPSATVKELGLPRRRTPARPGEVRARAAALRTFLHFSDPSLEAIVVTLEDAWDATIACLTAWLACDDLDQPFRSTDHPRTLLETEGWIYRPPATLP